MFGKRHLSRCRAFTLTETMVGIAVSSVILTALVSFTIYAAKSFAAMQNYTDLEQKSQNALDIMTRDIREVQFLTNYGTATINGQTVTNVVTFVTDNNDLLTFNYTNGVLMRDLGGVSTMLLTNVDYLCFQLYQRNTIGGTYDQYQFSDTSHCKLVSVNWICSRSILGSKINTECVQTTKIVIRKQ